MNEVDDLYVYHDPYMMRHEMEVEEEHQESCLEREYDRWNYYEASIEDEIRTFDRPAPYCVCRCYCNSIPIRSDDAKHSTD